MNSSVCTASMPAQCVFTGSANALCCRTEAGRKLEPLEEVTLEVADEHAGPCIATISLRKGVLQEMCPVGVEGSGKQRLVFEVPSRGMIGFKSVFSSLTRGEGLMQRAFCR